MRRIRGAIWLSASFLLLLNVSLFSVKGLDTLCPNVMLMLTRVPHKFMSRSSINSDLPWLFWFNFSIPVKMKYIRKSKSQHFLTFVVCKAGEVVEFMSSNNKFCITKF